MADFKNNSLWKKLMDRFQHMAAIRLPIEERMKNQVDLLRPELSAWDDVEDAQQGQKRNVDVFNSAPQEALETWADGMLGHLASPAMPWFIYADPDEEMNLLPEIRRWMLHAESRIYGVMKDSNYYSHLSPIFLDAGSLGSAPGWIELNEQRDGIACLTFHPREIYVDQNHHGEINQFVRNYRLTAMTAAAQFDKTKLSDALVRCLSQNPLVKHKFLHATFQKQDPIFDGESGLPDRPWISVDIEISTDITKQKPLRIEGYWTKPFTYWRYQKTADSPYGWGRGCTAVADIFRIHQITKSNLTQGEFSTDPALYSPGVQRGLVEMQPGGRTFGKAEDMPKVLWDGGKYVYSVDQEDRAVQAIERVFNVPFFEMLNRADRQMTAYEIGERLNEKGILLAPKTGRLNHDQFDENHKRIFDIAWREGWIDPPPAILTDRNGGGQIEIEYNGILEQAQRIAREIKQTQGVYEQVLFLAQAKEDVMDNFNVDRTAVRIARNRSLPEDEIRTEDEVNAIRQQRAEVRAAQEKLAMLKEGAETLPALSKAPEAGSPLEALTGSKA